MNPPIVKTALEPFATVQEAKDFLRYTDTDQDALFAELIEAATALVEDRLAVSLVSKTYRLWLTNREATTPVWLPMRPVLGIASVKSYDEDGTETVNAAGTYRLAQPWKAPRLVAVGSGWTTGREEDAVRVEFAAGYRIAATASGAGSSTAALVLSDAVGLEQHVGRAIFNRTTPWAATTIDAASGSSITLSAARTWSSGDVITFGAIPAMLRTYALQQFARLALSRLPADVLPAGQIITPLSVAEQKAVEAAYSYYPLVMV